MNPLKKFLKNDRASVGLVVTLIATVVVLVIGVIILANFDTAVPAVTGAANTTAEAILTAGWNAFSLAIIIPIIVVAGAIIGYVVRGFGGAPR